MKKRDFNLYISVLAFIAGALFLLSNDAGITGNVTGVSPEGATFTAFIGIMIIIASTVFFILIIDHGQTDIETLVRRDENKHDDLTKKHAEEAALKEKYGYNAYNGYNKK